MVLVVDDHEDTCKAVRALLKCERIEAVCLHDPLLAVAEIRRSRPEVVILDQMMPGMLGTDVLASIRADPEIALTAVIMYSASDTGKAEASSMGAPWVRKTNFGWSQLRETVRESLKLCGG